MDISQLDVPQLLDTQRELAEKTILQIKKDFETNGLAIQLAIEQNPSYPEICTAMEQVLDWLFERDRQKLMQLLYRIDIPEQKLKEALEGNSSSPVVELLAALIVRREAQKVIIRHYYQQNR